MLTRRTIVGTAVGALTSLAGAKGWALSSAQGVRSPLARQSRLQRLLGGKILFSGDGGYEAARQAATWNARKPSRYPRAIVTPTNIADVVAAVQLAKQRGWQVATRSGGHSWTAPHTRDNAILINLSQMKEISVDQFARIAAVSPAWEGQALNKILRDDYRLMFPSGHCHGVGLGGFIMCGGHGWNSRLWGPGCANLAAVDVVTADAKLMHASETRNSDYLWAARGGGPGFFGVAVRYYLNLHPLPTSMKRSTYVYPADAIDEVIGWLHAVQGRLPKYLEASVMACSDGSGRQILRLNGAALAYSDQDAIAALTILESCPALGKAISKELYAPTIFPAEQESNNELNPKGMRYVVDGTWTNASAAQIIPAIREFFLHQPTPQSYFLWLCWAPVQQLPDMAYSLQGETYLSPCALSADPADDVRCAQWVARAVEALEPYSIGGQMNDENMAVNRRPYLSESAASRLEAMRIKYDPDHVFAGFLSA